MTKRLLSTASSCKFQTTFVKQRRASFILQICGLCFRSCERMIRFFVSNTTDNLFGDSCMEESNKTSNLSVSCALAVTAFNYGF